MLTWHTTCFANGWRVRKMAKQEEEITNLVVENVPEEPMGGMNGNNPTVLSCGGIYVPRPRPFNPKE